ncbi:MAG TPA: aspartate aminotransferase family protein [Bacteroidia bacterium]|nr:aspartate aminotransferase family protein [Bacteroidia bacterium]
MLSSFAKMITHRQLFLQHLAQTTDAPLMLEIERAKGVHLFDTNGKSYLDLISGIGVSNVGHRHPEVLKAIQEQLDKYMHLMVYGEYIQAPQTLFAKALTDALHPTLNSCYFVNSGAEATDAAMKLAKRFTGRTELVACYNAYRPLLPDINFIHFNTTDDLAKITSRTAAVFIEPVQGEAGYLPAEQAYLHALRKRCDETGTLLIFDEIQTGFGRTGSLFAFHQYKVVPDMVLLAKGMAGGMPMGALVAPHHIMQAFSFNPILGHITTFGGHPVSCAAALATLKILQSSNLIQQVAAKEALFRKHLHHPAIQSITGKGLMLALDLGSFEQNKKIIDRCIADGLITDWFLFASHKMRIAPPLIISEEEIIQSCDIIVKNINAA